MSFDYGLGRTNIDLSNGIRYGVISTHSLDASFWESVENDYGPPSCPKCGSENLVSGDAVTDDDAEEGYEPYRGRSCVGDHWCESCRIYFDHEDATPDDPIGWNLFEVENGETVFHAVDCLDSDVMVLKSRYYTFAPFCSPCVPGAGNLDSTSDNMLAFVRTSLRRIGHADLSGPDDFVPFGVKTYCPDKLYFSKGACPYPYWSVETNELAYVPEHEPEEEIGHARQAVLERQEADDVSELTVIKLEALRTMPIEEPSSDVIDEIVKAYRGENGIPASELGVAGEEFLHDDWETQKRNEDQ